MKSPLDPPPNPTRRGNSEYGPDAKYLIHFEDQGQDFLTFVVTHEGKVLDARPFQGWIYRGRGVMNLRELLTWRENNERFPGTFGKPRVEIDLPSILAPWRHTSIKYPVTRVEIL